MTPAYKAHLWDMLLARIKYGKFGPSYPESEKLDAIEYARTIGVAIEEPEIIGAAACVDFLRWAKLESCGSISAGSLAGVFERKAPATP